MANYTDGRERALSLLAGGIADGRAFFDLATEALVIGLGYRWGGVARLSEGGERLELMSLREYDRLRTPLSYDLAGSPCEKVYGAPKGQAHIFIPGGVAERFPECSGLGKIGAVCYRGEVFHDADGKPAGHVFAMDDREDGDDPNSRAFFRLVAQRVGAEYNHMRTGEALRESEARTRAAEQRLRDAIESIPSGFVLFDPEDRLVLCNQTWMDLYGYSEEDVRPGATYEDLVLLDAERGAVAGDPELYVRQKLAYRKQFRGSFDLQLRDGRWITIREGKTAEGGTVGVQTEITDRMEAIESLLGENAATEQANDAKSEFVARISHEMRTPLNAIIGFSDIIQDARFGPIGNPKYREYAGDIVSSGRHLLELVNGLLDLAKLESGVEELRDEVLDIAETVRAALVFVRETAETKGVALELRVSEDVPKLRADPSKLKQILINLLANGIRFTDPGGRVVVMVHGDPQAGVAFEIADTGSGIAQEDIEGAMRAYGQVGVALDRTEKGTGLGLPLAVSLAELHGGSLELDSVPGFGTLVTVRLPPERAVRGGEARRANNG